MANVIARARGYRKSGEPRQQNEQTALGDSCVVVQGATWQTFATLTMNKDGSGYITIKRGDQMFRVTWNEETETLQVSEVSKL